MNTKLGVFNNILDLSIKQLWLIDTAVSLKRFLLWCLIKNHKKEDDYRLLNNILNDFLQERAVNTDILSYSK